MLKNLIKYKFRILLILVLILALVCIRAFENELFYDPFLNYFKSNYQNINYPVINNFKLFLNLFFRFFLNTTFSLSIIYVIFKDIEIVKFASVLFTFFFIVLIISFFICLFYFAETNKITLFYIRRFLIQPILLLLFLPGFYFQSNVAKT